LCNIIDLSVGSFKLWRYIYSNSHSSTQRKVDHAYIGQMSTATAHLSHLLLSLASLVVIRSSSAEGCSPDLLDCVNRTPACHLLTSCAAGVLGKRAPAATVLANGTYTMGEMFTAADRIYRLLQFSNHTFGNEVSSSGNT